MHLSGIDLFFWAAGFIVHLVLLFVLFYRHRARVFPFFTALILLNVVRTVVLYLVLHYGSKDGYFYTFWSLAVLDVVAQLGVVYEVASRVFRPLDVWAPDVRGKFPLAVEPEHDRGLGPGVGGKPGGAHPDTSVSGPG